MGEGDEGAGGGEGRRAGGGDTEEERATSRGEAGERASGRGAAGERAGWPSGRGEAGERTGRANGDDPAGSGMPGTGRAPTGHGPPRPSPATPPPAALSPLPPPSPRPRRPTMADVAARVGVSRALVSLVFRDQPGASAETRERVLQAAAELGYRPDIPARVLASGRSRVLGVLFTVRNPFHVDLVEAIYPAAENLGYSVVLSAHVPARDEHNAIEALIGHRSEALILLGPVISAKDIAGYARSVPTVVVGRGAPGAPVDVVTTADGKGVREAMDYLVELGHREIVHVDGGTGPGSAQRRRAYRDTMRRHGLDEHARVLPGDHTEESGARAARLLLAEDRLPTAVFAGNDRCAMGLLDVFGRAGVRVPGDISIVGYDDSHIAGLSHIDLTTVRQDVDRMAELAVRVANEQLADGREAGARLLLDSKLVIRGTTGPPPGR